MSKKILLLIVLGASLLLLSGCGMWGHHGSHGYHGSSTDSQIDSSYHGITEQRS